MDYKTLFAALLMILVATASTVALLETTEANQRLLRERSHPFSTPTNMRLPCYDH